MLDSSEPFHEEYAHDVMHQAKAFTMRDLHDIIQTDAMLGNFGDTVKASIGSSIEIGYGHVLQKPIVTIIPKTTLGANNIHDHPMIREMTLVTPSLFDGMRAICHLLLPSSVLDRVDLEQRYLETEMYIRGQGENFWRRG